MPIRGWQERILESTRGRVLALLRREPRTVSDLAKALALTDNAVRQHLSGLERDGLVEQRGTRREWTGKPAYVYGATARVEALYPKPYDAVLGELLAVLGEHEDPEAVEALLRRVGARLGGEVPDAAAGGTVAPGTPEELRARVERAAAVLTSLGGLAEVQETEDGYLLQGYSCPLAALTRDHPAMCALAEALVAEVVGAPVQECCDRGDRPRCAFRVNGPQREQVAESAEGSFASDAEERGGND